MMNSRCLRLIAITILINCVYTGRLTDDENKERIANCGNAELSTPKGGEGDGGIHISKLFYKYLVKVETLKHTGNTATGFFISPRHILTSSQSVFNKERQWLVNTTDQITKEKCVSNMIVPQVYTDKIQIRWHDSLRAHNATLLAFCRPKTDDFHIFFSPMLVELEANQNDVQFPCLADNSTEVKPGALVHAHRWQWDQYTNDNRLQNLQYMNRKIVKVEDEFITTGRKQYKEKVRGGPLVMHKTPKGTLAIGIDATTGFDDEAQSTYYHNIKALEKDICDYSGVCAPPPPPPRTEATTTPEEETTTLNPDTQISTDRSPSDSSGLSTPKPTEKPSVATKKSTTPPQRTIDEFEVAPDDILYDEDKRRAEEPDVNNDFFVSADFMTDSIGKAGLYWTVGTLAMVLLA
ncbi:unnamed protein product [Caenorhabditis brenneri]